MSGSFNRYSGSAAGYILCIVLGIVICIWPGTILLTLCRIAGLAILLFGIYKVIISIKRNYVVDNGGALFLGIVLCALGIWILSAPGTFLKLIPIVIGLVLIYHGVKDIYTCVQFRRSHNPRWWGSLIIGILALVFGVLLIRGAFLALEIGMIIFGIALIYTGVTGLWISHRGGGRDRIIDVDYRED